MPGVGCTVNTSTSFGICGFPGTHVGRTHEEESWEQPALPVLDPTMVPFLLLSGIGNDGSSLASGSFRTSHVVRAVL